MSSDLTSLEGLWESREKAKGYKRSEHSSQSVSKFHLYYSVVHTIGTQQCGVQRKQSMQ
ncbi:hypothetical protein QJS04_geneDACA016308 [Acorus gramineus]|uniref:Uncharacterized protein n=1 Tax=Acorus gramineus TaxID=55184 RepID=A0AAV9ASU8_ACOGR|nr:hypothetical protein QJS04_geneDACA016308 [Acorus gramineus]